MKIVKMLKSVDRALLIGIGGGGDAVSTLAVGEFFKLFNVECIYGGVIWERVTRDKKPGPLSIEEIENCKKINDCLAWINPNSNYRDLKLIVAQVAEFLGCDVVGVDLTKGERGLTECLKDFVDSEGIDLVVGVDAGGDSLARGHERGLHSPLADAIVLASLNKLNSIVAIVGFGSDGELSREELELYLSEIARMDGVLGASLITKDFADKVADFVENVYTTASKIPILSSQGYYGKMKVWDKAVIDVSILNALIFYVNTYTIYKLSKLPKAVEGTENVWEANRKLHEIGIKTELDHEIEVFEREFKGT
ncbi:DUF1152 domain-containing protein [Archaeoglobus sp.]